MPSKTQGPLLAICGPTATGKTRLALSLAKKFPLEIVSVDSRQVYQGLDIGTGKDLPLQAKFFSQPCLSPSSKFQVGYHLFGKTPVWLYDVVPPSFRFDLAHYLACARPVIQDVWQRRKIPCLVGGTGFYLQGLLSPPPTLGIPPDKSLRQRLGKKTLPQLQKELAEVNPSRFAELNSSDRQNPRRLIRAIEVSHAKPKNTPPLVFTEIIKIGLSAPLPELYRRIDQRVQNRLRAGLLTEIKTLLKKFSFKDPGFESLGYSLWEDFLKGQATQAETIKAWCFSEHAYARRQLTWFKKDPDLHWFDCLDPGLGERVTSLIRQWYTKEKLSAHAQKD